MEQVEQPTSEKKCDSPVDVAAAQEALVFTGVSEVQSSPRTDLNPVQTLEDSTWMAVLEGETASSDCGGTSDLQEPSSASGEEVEGNETSDAAGLEVSPSRKRSRGGTLQNGDKTSQESPQQNRDTPVTAQRIPGKTALTHQKYYDILTDFFYPLTPENMCVSYLIHGFTRLLHHYREVGA